MNADVDAMLREYTRVWCSTCIPWLGSEPFYFLICWDGSHSRVSDLPFWQFFCQLRMMCVKAVLEPWGHSADNKATIFLHSFTALCGFLHHCHFSLSISNFISFNIRNGVCTTTENPCLQPSSCFTTPWCINRNNYQLQNEASENYQNTHETNSCLNFQQCTVQLHQFHYFEKSFGVQLSEKFWIPFRNFGTLPLFL